MAGSFKFGNKLMKKSWNSSEIDQDAEYRKIGLVLLGVMILMVLMALLMWWIRKSLK